MAKWVKPLEFIQSNDRLKNCHVLLISASGNNADIIKAYTKALDAINNDSLIGILCTSACNKLTNAVNSHFGSLPKVITYATDIPTKKDGFLATTTLFCICLWLLRAYGISMHDEDELGELFLQMILKK